MKPHCLEVGKDQAPLGGLNIPSLPPPVCCPSFLSALGSLSTPSILPLQGRGLVRSCGANREEGHRHQGSLAPSNTTLSWVGRESLGSWAGPLM